MELTTAQVLGVGLFLLLLVPFLVLAIRQGRAHGHTWFTRSKPRGHSDIGPDTGPTPTAPGGVDKGRGLRQ